jgi:hypothetical protein
MVIHQAIRVAEPVIALDDLSEERKNGLPVCVIHVDGSTRVATAGHMVKSAGKVEAQGAWHIPTMEEGETMRCRPDPLTSTALSLPGNHRFQWGIM